MHADDSVESFRQFVTAALGDKRLRGGAHAAIRLLDAPRGPGLPPLSAQEFASPEAVERRIKETLPHVSPGTARSYKSRVLALARAFSGSHRNEPATGLPETSNGGQFIVNVLLSFAPTCRALAEVEASSGWTIPLKKVARALAEVNTAIKDTKIEVEKHRAAPAATLKVQFADNRFAVSFSGTNRFDSTELDVLCTVVDIFERSLNTCRVTTGADS